MLQRWWKGSDWRKTKRLRNASQVVIPATFPVPRVAGYQGHALHDVRPRPRRAKSNATDLDNPSLARLFTLVLGGTCLCDLCLMVFLGRQRLADERPLRKANTDMP